VDTNTKIVTGNTSNSYPTHKTISLVDEKAVVNKVAEVPVPNLVKNAEKTPVQNPPPVNDKVALNAYPSHKTIVIATESAKPTVDALKKEADNLITKVTSVPEVKVEIPVIVPQQKNVVVESIQKKVEQSPLVDSYPVHKSVSLENSVLADKKLETNTVEKVIEPSVSKSNTSDEVKQTVAKPVDPKINTTTDNDLKNIYPAHKTFSFGVTDVKQEDTKTVVTPAQIAATVESKNQPLVQATKNTAVEAKESAPVEKAKKPLVWIIASATILATSAAAIWYTNQQKIKLQEEVTALKQSNAELSENVQKLQKDLHIDDIIARAGKLDAKNNIIVEQDATKSEVIRTCFSVMPNTNAKNGKKIVYVRLLDSMGNVVAVNKNNTFEYKGAKMEYTEKKEIDFKGAELMLCVDYKSTQKLEKGTYKAELYNDGVLDGTASFELK
jgi:hypothetical protein